MLYEVAVIEHSAEKDGEDKLLLPPTPVIAKDEKTASALVFLVHADALRGAQSRLEVFVRPFTIEPTYR